jgi:hypothetical protein
MKPELKDLVVMRVANGWIIRPSRDSHNGYMETFEIHVARTPGELAQLMTDWAHQQLGVAGV